VTCVGERVDLQPFDDAAMKQLLLRYPVQPRSFGATLQHALGADFAAQGLVVVDYTHPSTVHTNAQARPTLAAALAAATDAATRASFTRAMPCRSSWAPRGATAPSWCA
jgi:hypothetical protein